MYYWISCYHPHMRIGNNFSRVCLSVCLYVCVSVCVSVQTITFELLKLGTSFLAYRYILIISRSNLSIKVMGQGQGQMKNLDILLLLLYACLPLELTKRSRSSEGQGQGFTVSRLNERKSIFCLFANVFVIYVLRRWYAFDWKAFLLN